MSGPIEATIDAAWDNRDSIDASDPALRDAVGTAILRLDSGEERVAEKVDSD